MAVESAKQHHRPLPPATRGRASAAPGARAAIATPTTPAIGTDAFDRAFSTVKTTLDPAVAKGQVDVMQRSLQAMKAAGARDLEPLQADLQTAAERAQALPIIVGTPRLPVPTLGRVAVHSAALPTPEQAAQASAIMAGYTGNKPAGFAQMLTSRLPFGNTSAPVSTPAFDKLNAKDQQTVISIAQAADPAGQIALHTLLATGKLTPSLLGALQGLTTDRLAADVDRKALLSQTMIELADPVSICQGTRGTCAATCIQILMATKEPAVYVGLLRGLASPAGTAALPGGAGQLKRDAEWAITNDGGRSTPSRLLQPALMALAGAGMAYRNANDTNVNPKTHEEQPAGLDGAAAAYVLNAVMEDHPGYATLGAGFTTTLPASTISGINNNIRSTNDYLMVLENRNQVVMDPKDQAELMAKIAAAAKPEDPVYCTVLHLRSDRSGVEFHAVLVTGVQNGRVNLINPWGREESLSADAFKGSIVSANMRQAGFKTPPPAQSFDSDTGARVFTTSEGDTLWLIAARMLGDGRRWAEIADLNAKHHPEFKTSPGKIKAGLTIALPQD